MAQATFSFGRNWKNYVRNSVDKETIAVSKASLLGYLSEEEFKGKTFIDIGCGSGLFSLSALLLGCQEVISLDLDSLSLEATRLLKDIFSHLIPKGYRWEIFKGDILDTELTRSLAGKADIVYSWGVLHHTGNMWGAIENAARLVKGNGYLIISIYNRAPSSRQWKKIKEFYNRLPLLQPLIIAACLAPGCVLAMIKNKAWNLRKERGMHIFYDLIDWLGGYPYEYASFEEVRGFVEKIGFTLVKSPTRLKSATDRHSSIYSLVTAKDTACNEFMFLKRICHA